MALIEIPLNSYRYHFRRLPWREEARLKFPEGVDQRKILLSAAMVDVSGLKIDREGAMRIFEQMPGAIFWRIWLLYRGSLPQDRYYTADKLYEAPDPMVYRKQMHDDEQKTEAVADAAAARLESQFGRAEVGEADAISRRMFQNAQAAGTLVRASEDSSHG